MEEVIESSDEEDNNNFTRLVQQGDPTKTTALLKHRSSSPPQPPHPQTPLLMPPPSTTISTIQNHFRVQNHHLRLWLADPENVKLVTTTTKIGIFLLKMAIMNWHCSSGMVRPGIFYSLMALAAVDLVVRRGWKWHVAAMGVHVGIVELGVIGGRLCRGGMAEWENWDGDLD